MLNKKMWTKLDDDASSEIPSTGSSSSDSSSEPDECWSGACT